VTTTEPVSTSATTAGAVLDAALATVRSAMPLGNTVEAFVRDLDAVIGTRADYRSPAGSA
jgi:hypothetical protein